VLIKLSILTNANICGNSLVHSISKFSLCRRRRKQIALTLSAVRRLIHRSVKSYNNTPLTLKYINYIASDEISQLNCYTSSIIFARSSKILQAWSVGTLITSIAILLSFRLYPIGCIPWNGFLPSTCDVW
jgi:hypothetical protein